MVLGSLNNDDSVFILEWHLIAITHSTDFPNIQEISQRLKIFDVKLIQSLYPQTTHFLTEGEKSSTKLLTALIHRVPIISIDFIKELERVSFLIEKSDFESNFPISNKFVPHQSLKLMDERKSLFNGFIFIFCDGLNQVELINVIKEAEGKILNFNIIERNGNSKKIVHPMESLIEFIKNNSNHDDIGNVILVEPVLKNNTINNLRGETKTDHMQILIIMEEASKVLGIELTSQSDFATAITMCDNSHIQRIRPPSVSHRSEILPKKRKEIPSTSKSHSLENNNDINNDTTKRRKRRGNIRKVTIDDIFSVQSQISIENSNQNEASYNGSMSIVPDSNEASLLPNQNVSSFTKQSELEPCIDQQQDSLNNTQPPSLARSSRKRRNIVKFEAVLEAPENSSPIPKTSNEVNEIQGNDASIVVFDDDVNEEESYAPTAERLRKKRLASEEISIRAKKPKINNDPVEVEVTATPTIKPNTKSKDKKKEKILAIDIIKQTKDKQKHQVDVDLGRGSDDEDNEKEEDWVSKLRDLVVTEDSTSIMRTKRPVEVTVSVSLNPEWRGRKNFKGFRRVWSLLRYNEINELTKIYLSHRLKEELGAQRCLEEILIQQVRFMLSLSLRIHKCYPKLSQVSQFYERNIGLYDTNIKYLEPISETYVDIDEPAALANEADSFQFTTQPRNNAKTRSLRSKNQTRPQISNNMTTEQQNLKRSKVKRKETLKQNIQTNKNVNTNSALFISDPDKDEEGMDNNDDEFDVPNTMNEFDYHDKQIYASDDIDDILEIDEGELTKSFGKADSIVSSNTNSFNRNSSRKKATFSANEDDEDDEDDEDNDDDDDDDDDEEEVKFRFRR